MTVKQGELMRIVYREFLLKIINFADYYIYEKMVTLSEATLLALAVIRAMWYATFGLDGTIMSDLFPQSLWVGIFGLLALAHVIAISFRSLWPRVIIHGFYTVLWGFLAVLGVIAHSQAPSAPSYVVFTLLSVFIAVRLYDEIETSTGA